MVVAIVVATSLPLTAGRVGGRGRVAGADPDVVASVGLEHLDPLDQILEVSDGPDENLELVVSLPLVLLARSFRGLFPQRAVLVLLLAVLVTVAVASTARLVPVLVFVLRCGDTTVIDGHERLERGERFVDPRPSHLLDHRVVELALGLPSRSGRRLPSPSLLR